MAIVEVSTVVSITTATSVLMMAVAVAGLIERYALHNSSACASTYGTHTSLISVVQPVCTAAARGNPTVARTVNARVNRIFE